MNSNQSTTSNELKDACAVISEAIEAYLYSMNAVVIDGRAVII